MTGAAADPAVVLDVAVEAARAAGALLVERFAVPAAGVRTKSTPTDLVSEADVAAERAIRAVLARRRPGDAVLGEELAASGPATAGGPALRWIVDPLDGTVNFLFGIPAWAVSVACADGEGTLAGVVHDPLRDETFTARRDGPACLGGRAIERPRRGTTLATALVGTGFGYDAGLRARQAAVAAGVLPRVRDLRRVGAAALDLAWLAAGRLDAFYERGLKAWDMAAGALVCARAGLEVRELAARDGLPAGVIAGPAELVAALEPLVR